MEILQIFKVRKGMTLTVTLKQSKYSYTLGGKEAAGRVVGTFEMLEVTDRGVNAQTETDWVDETGKKRHDFMNWFFDFTLFNFHVPEAK